MEVIELKYADTNVKVKPQMETWFSIKSGDLQGDTLAPFLFIIMLDYALRKATDEHEHDSSLHQVSPEEQKQLH